MSTASTQPISAPIPLRERILKQLEYYFSVENLCKDVYLIGQMREGAWVPLRTVSKFKMVRALTNQIPSDPSATPEDTERAVEEVLLSVLKGSVVVEVSPVITADGPMIRPTVRPLQTSLVISDVPVEATAPSIVELFKGINYVIARPETAGVWVATFPSEAETLQALAKVKDGKLGGRAVKAFVRSEVALPVFYQQSVFQMTAAIPPVYFGYDPTPMPLPLGVQVGGQGGYNQRGKGKGRGPAGGASGSTTTTATAAAAAAAAGSAGAASSGASGASGPAAGAATTSGSSGKGKGRSGHQQEGRDGNASSAKGGKSGPAAAASAAAPAVITMDNFPPLGGAGAGAGGAGGGGGGGSGSQASNGPAAAVSAAAAAKEKEKPISYASLASRPAGSPTSAPSSPTKPANPSGGGGKSGNATPTVVAAAGRPASSPSATVVVTAAPASTTAPTPAAAPAAATSTPATNASSSPVNPVQSAAIQGQRRSTVGYNSDYVQWPVAEIMDIAKDIYTSPGGVPKPSALRCFAVLPTAMTTFELDKPRPGPDEDEEIESNSRRGSRMSTSEGSHRRSRRGPGPAGDHSGGLGASIDDSSAQHMDASESSSRVRRSPAGASHGASSAAGVDGRPPRTPRQKKQPAPQPSVSPAASVETQSPEGKVETVKAEPRETTKPKSWAAAAAGAK